MPDQPDETPEAAQSPDRTLDGGMEYGIPLPDSAIPLAAVEVVEYIDEDGDHAYAYRVQGTQSPAQVAGLLEVVKSRFLDAANYGSTDD